MQQVINHLKPENARLQYSIGRDEKAKLEFPPKFKGDWEQLNGFLLQLRTCFRAYPKRFSDEDSKVRFAVSRLEGRALHWFEPTLEDNLDHTGEAWAEHTREIFSDFSKFAKGLEKVFGDPPDQVGRHLCSPVPTRCASFQHQQLRPYAVVL